MGSCNFDSSFCSWTNTRVGDNFNWTRHRGSTGSSNTGPSTDHTTKNTYLGNYKNRNFRTIWAVRILLCNYVHLTGVFAFLYYNIFRFGLSVHIGKINYNISHLVHVKSSLYTKALYISATLSFTQFAIFWQIKNKRLNRNVKRVSVPPIRIVKSNVTRSVDPSSEKNISCFSLTNGLRS